MIFLYLILSAFLIWYIQTQKIFSMLAGWMNEFFYGTTFFSDLLECSFCVGFWICTGLSFIIQVDFFTVTGYTNLVGHVLTGMVTSVMYTYIVEGIKTKHQVVVISNLHKG